jgi:prepilin-type processing-associated H-X9-DG protein
MKQVFLANFNYGSDNDGYIPPSCGYNGGYIVPYSKYWSDVVVYQGYLDVPKVNSHGALNEEPPSGAMLCPEEKRSHYDGGTEWLSWLGSHFGQTYGSICYIYDINGVINSPHIAWLRFFAIPKPSEICFLGDKNISDGSIHSPNISPYHITETVSFRHSGGANFIFSDGHLDWIAYDNFPQDKRDVFWGFKCFRSDWE